MAIASFHSFLDQAEAQLDKVVDNGSDQELFIASYLHGHFSLAVSQALQSEVPNVDGLNTVLLKNLQDAFDNHELEPVDQQQVLKLWSQLKDQT